MQARGRAWIAAVTAALAVVISAPASAGAMTFGTDLSKPANTPGFTCSQGVYNQFLGQFLYGPFGGNCMWSSIPLGSSEALEPSMGGTVTTVRIKAGAVGGQMQVNVIRFLTSNGINPGTPNLACCFVETYGPIFFAEANTTTTVQTNLHMTEDPFPPPGDLTTIAANDVLALSVLEPNTPIPLYATNGGANDLNVLSYAWYPAPTTPTVPAPSPNPIGGFADMSGFQVLMNADLTPDGGGGGAPAGGGGAPAGGGGPPAGGGGGGKVGPPPVPAIGLPNLTVPINGNTATVPLQCLVVDCTGTLTLQNAQLAGLANAAKAKKTKKPKKPKVVSYGSASFSIKAGTTGKVKVTLNGNGRRLLKGHKSAKVWATVRFSSGGGAPKSVLVKLTK